MIANQENTAGAIVTDRPGSGTETARPTALMTRAPGGTDSDMSGIARAALAHTGTARYDGLSQQRHRPLQVTGPVVCRRHHAHVPANKCAFSCVQLPMTSTDPVNGPSPELVVSRVLQRAHTDGVAKLGDRYLDGGLLTPGSLAGVFDELLDTGLLALADPDRDGLRQVTLTTAGHT